MRRIVCQTDRPFPDTAKHIFSGCHYHKLIKAADRRRKKKKAAMLTKFSVATEEKQHSNI